MRLAVGAAKEREAKRIEFSRPVDLGGGRQRVLDAELVSPLKGFNLLLQDEAPAIGSGQRLVMVQLRGKRVHLYHGCYTATLNRLSSGLR
jgi:hypothetical protein